MDEAVSEVRRLSHVHTLAHVLNWANRLDWFTGSPMGHIEEYLALTTEHGFSAYLGFALACRGRSLIALGKAQEGLALLTQALAQLRSIGCSVGSPLLLRWLAE